MKMYCNLHNAPLIMDRKKCINQFIYFANVNHIMMSWYFQTNRLFFNFSKDLALYFVHSGDYLVLYHKLDTVMHFNPI